MADHDLRSFLARLETAGQLRRVDVPVDPELESTALCLRALREGGPALLMEHPVGSGHPLLGNLFGHRDRIEAVLAGRPLASLRELGELLAAGGGRCAAGAGRPAPRLAARVARRGPCSPTRCSKAATSTSRACRSSAAGRATPGAWSRWAWSSPAAPASRARTSASTGCRS